MPARRLPAGEHEVVVEYYEHLGRAVAQVRWEQVPGADACPTGQFLAQYYNGRTITGAPVFSRCEASINYDWGVGSGPGGGIGKDNFSVRWVGLFSFSSRSYSFRARTDDGMKVLLDGASILSKWYDQAPTSYTFSRSIVAGEHVIQVDYYERTGAAVAQLRWE